jgi:DNA-binding MarR family transcriptional regulator
LTSDLSIIDNDNQLVVLGATTMNTGNDAYKVTWLIRRLFRAMAEEADAYLRHSGLTAADRAVMEFLYPDSKLTVPQIARRYHVSRQHVQVTANRLLEEGLLRAHENPQHKRSPLLRLSQLGRDTFTEIRRNEDTLLDALYTDIEIADIATTRRTLESLLRNFKQGETT